jgi:hypothetical protein
MTFVLRLYCNNAKRIFYPVDMKTGIFRAIWIASTVTGLQACPMAQPAACGAGVAQQQQAYLLQQQMMQQHQQRQMLEAQMMAGLQARRRHHGGVMFRKMGRDPRHMGVRQINVNVNIRNAGRSHRTTLTREKYDVYTQHRASVHQCVEGVTAGQTACVATVTAPVTQQILSERVIPVSNGVESTRCIPVTTRAHSQHPNRAMCAEHGEHVHATTRAHSQHHTMYEQMATHVSGRHAANTAHANTETHADVPAKQSLMDILA